ncbi:hypothetical protein SDC9_35584 [bioreactor metagenome]|jgi:hypothetical protein|uniref:Uncharacterized protein n=1 Tax=bioreactor metagenome TaxID=1076179 RepID=A0A644VDY8_9ZZZZ|nr:MAG: hypothetical protein BGO84_03080 [Dysgonomonas sp. 37-18]OJX90828.1 MAG: hypothetical protein BGP01_05555 [Paludibacter sp. 47-17]PKP37790.1 MAG: hypothetical protein CVT97_04235 [Bacteroidetes bacterium HGW-Bacteroidetes-14]
MPTSKVNLANIESVPQGGFYLHRQMASCVLSASKPFSVPENDLPLAGENASEVSVFWKDFRVYWLAAMMYH